MTGPHRDQVVFIGSLRMGGGESAVRGMLLALPDELRARVQVVLLRDPDAPAHARELGLPVTDLGASGVIDATWRLRRWLRGRGVRRVHAHLVQCIVAAGLALLGRPEQLVVFIHAFGTWKQDPRPRDRLRIALESWTVRRAEAIVYVAQRIRREHEDRLAYPIGLGRVIPNLVPGEGPLAVARDSRVLSLVSVGRVEPVKGYDWVLDLPMASELLRGNRWTLLGDGSSRAALREKVARLGLPVTLPGSSSQVAKELVRHDVFFMPSHSEGLSVALLEACRAGLPLLATDVGSNGEVVENGVNGFLIPVGDGPALAAALEQLRDPRLRALMGRESRRLFAERYSPQVLLPQLEVLFT